LSPLIDIERIAIGYADRHFRVFRPSAAASVRTTTLPGWRLALDSRLLGLLNYGFEFFGDGYAGGRWDGETFYYNRAVSNINVTNIHNVYSTTIANNITVRRKLRQCE
jgi:hypothetical protein